MFKKIALFLFLGSFFINTYADEIDVKVNLNANSCSGRSGACFINETHTDLGNKNLNFIMKIVYKDGLIEIRNFGVVSKLEPKHAIEALVSNAYLWDENSKIKDIFFQILDGNQLLNQCEHMIWVRNPAHHIGQSGNQLFCY